LFFEPTQFVMRRVEIGISGQSQVLRVGLFALEPSVRQTLRIDSKATQLGGSPPVTIAKTLLRELAVRTERDQQ